MVISPQIFKAYDIRGIYPQDLDEENIVPIIRAIYTFLKPSSIVVGRDMRLSSPILTQAAIKTLVNLGADIIDIGLVSTPTFYFTVFHYGYDAGIQVTASHNPKEWNGIKIIKNSPKGLIKIGKSTGMEEIEMMVLKEVGFESPKKGAVTRKTDVLTEEVKNALKITGYPKIKRFKIVADAANAMGGQYIEALFQEIPGELIKMNFELDGTFPSHQPNPLQTETLVDLQKRVAAENADFGLAPDGDGDRLFFIDEKGQIVPPTIITSIVARELLKTHPNELILVDIRYLLAPQKIIKKNDGRLKVTKVGHAYITEAMHESGGIFAGESSAHYFFRETGNAEAPLPVILTVLKVLTEERKPLSQIVETLRRSFESGEYNFKVNNAQEIMELVKEKYQDGELVTLDGVAISYPDWRLSLRPSNTEPLLRFNVESYEKEVMERKRDELISLIKAKGKYD